MAREAVGTRNVAAEVTVEDGDKMHFIMCILVPVEPGVLPHQHQFSIVLTLTLTGLVLLCIVFCIAQAF